MKLGYFKNMLNSRFQKKEKIQPVALHYVLSLPYVLSRHLARFQLVCEMDGRTNGRTDEWTARHPTTKNELKINLDC